MSRELTIPERLDWLLVKRGVSQNALARVAQVSPQTIANTLHHGRVPRSLTTRRWARALGVPASVFATRPLTEDALLAVLEQAGPFRFEANAGATTTKRPTTKAGPTVTTTITTAKKPAAKKPSAKKTTAKKPAAKKATAKKATAKKPVAKKPVAKKAVAAKKSTAKKPATKRTTASRKPAVKAASARSNGSLGVDRATLLKKLVKLTNSKQDAVALDATKTLLTLVK